MIKSDPILREEGLVNQRVSAITRFVLEDPFLYSQYLFRADRMSDFPVDTFESYLVFVLWFLVHGRKSYPMPLVVGADLCGAVMHLNDAGCHALMYYLSGQEGLSLAGDDLRAWYYGEAVPLRQLAPFLTRSELRPADGGSAAALDMDRLFDPQRTGRPLSAEQVTLRHYLTGLASKAHQVGSGRRVAIVGFHRSVLGIGEDARSLFDCLAEAGIATELVDVSPPGLAPMDDADRYQAFEAARPTADVVIFCLPAFEMMRHIAALGLTRPSRPQYRIGYWPWETTSLPENWRHVYDAVDEVWASSTFLHDVYAPDTGKPVVHMPLHIRVEEPVLPDDLRPLFGSRFTFLTVFDFNSRIERKNPRGAIEAFKRAFPAQGEDVQMVLKTLHGETRPADLDAITDLIADDERFTIVDGALAKAELCGLIARADAYVSLHRSEGFGRPLAEAMLLGTPVIATGWSGCADFLNSRTGYPVRSVLRPVGPTEYPFAAGQWAEPDLDHAARMMRQLYAQRGTPSAVTAAAERMVSGSLGLRAVAERVGNRLSAIAAARDLAQH